MSVKASEHRLTWRWRVGLVLSISVGCLLLLAARTALAQEQTPLSAPSAVADIAGSLGIDADGGDQAAWAAPDDWAQALAVVESRASELGWLERRKLGRTFIEQLKDQASAGLASRRARSMSRAWVPGWSAAVSRPGVLPSLPPLSAAVRGR
jgi:hypothetical protein